MKIYYLLFLISTIQCFGQTNLEILNRLKNDDIKDVKKVNTLGDIYKITDKLTRKSFYKNLGEYKQQNKNLKANNVDTTVIYPSLLDTIQFNGMYDYWMTVDVGVSSKGTILAGDVNKNNKTELYGLRYDMFLNIEETSILEFNADLQEFELKTDIPLLGLSNYSFPRQLYDINNDNKDEFYINGNVSYSDTSSNTNIWGIGRTFKLSNDTNFPTELDFEYNVYDQVNDPLWGEYDKREGADLFYCSLGLYVAAARYNPLTNNADSVYRYNIPEDIFYLEGISNGDIDGDGFADLGTGGLRGDIVIFEYQEDIGHYKDVWYGDAGTYNVYNHFYSNDINGNGKKELWVGGAAFYNTGPKTRFTCLEAVGNNQYEAVHVIDIEGIFSFDASNGFTVDIDKDGTEEIGLCLDQTFLILKYNGNQQNWAFDLFYLKLNDPEITHGRYSGAMMYDIDRDGFEEILIMTDEVFGNYQYRKIFTKIYKPTYLVNVDNEAIEITNFDINQNYPNPFNPETKISYEVAKRSFVNISVYNILGEKIIDLVNEEHRKGFYEINFNGKELSSGVYLIRMQAEGFVKTVKAILIK